MTGPAQRGPDRGTGTPARSTRTRDAASALYVVLAVGLAFRLIIAQALPGSGFEVDLNAFRFWADNLARQGPFGFYDRPFFHDYTPGYLYVLWVIGVVGHLLDPLRGVVALPRILGPDLIKLPAILSDLGIAWLVWSMVQELGGSRRAALVGAVIVVVNPITWFDSVVWGQVDSVGALVVLVAVRELWRDRPERAAIFTVVAAVIKPQLGILVPIVAAVAIRRALVPVGGRGADDPESHEEPYRGRTTTRWERETRGPVRIATTAVAGLLTALLLCIPFALTPVGLIRQVAIAAGGYPFVTVNAYNPWALVEVDGNGVAATGSWICDVVGVTGARGSTCDVAVMFGPIPAVVVGTALLLLAVGVISIVVAARPDRLTILAGTAALALAFFILPTRVHERYLFPFYALAAILAAVSVRWLVAFAVMSAATLANMYVVLTTLYPNNPSIQDWLGIGPAIRSTPGVTLVALVHLAGFVWVAAQLRRESTETLANEIERTRDAQLDEASRAPEASAGSPVDPGLRPGADWTAGGRLLPGREPVLVREPLMAFAVSPQPMTPPVPAPFPLHFASPAPPPRARPTAPDVWAWVRERITERPFRPDRSAALAREPRGRLDRLDLWIVLVLLAATLTLRMWRLPEPYRMHFDEVYHARTATEFLQFWRYGISHDIYEWTHPHLAKYVMAAGIVAFGDDRVVAASDVNIPVRAALVEPRRDDGPAPSTRMGDRLDVATGAEIRSYDLATRKLEAITPLPGASALAYDATGERLFVGTDDGTIATIDTIAVDADRGTRASEPARLEANPVARIDGAVRQLHVPADGSALLVATDADDVITLNPDGGNELGRVTLRGIATTAAFADARTTPALVARPGEVVDPSVEASLLEDLLGGSARDYEERLTSDADRVVVATVSASGEARTAIDDAIAEDRLAGIAVESVPRVAVAYADGLALVSTADGDVLQRVALDGGAQGVTLVDDIDEPKLYATSNARAGPQLAMVTVGGDAAKDRAGLTRTFPLPGVGSWIGYDTASQQIHVLGAPPAGRPADQVATVYVIEPHANAVYADAPLTFRPAALALDVNALFQASDRQQLLALSAAGRTEAIDVGQHAFAWRLPGVVAGALMAVLLYLLTRVLFRRRSVAVVVALLTLFDGMFFVQSRIAMNDAYVGLFILAAYLVFAALWTGAWKSRAAFWVGMPAIGVLLGLAVASKWVAAYAIGALGILILARSALGRVVLIAGLVVATTVLGYMAISVPAGQSGGNLTFMLIMIALTIVAVVVTILHPIAWSRDEMRFAVAAPAVVGFATLLGAAAFGELGTVALAEGAGGLTWLHVSFALIGLSAAVAAIFWLAGHWGFGPLARRPEPGDSVLLLEPPAPAAEGWLRPGWAFGLPVAWMLVSMVAIPLAIYVLSYVPWAFVDSHRITGSWPPGHTGQTLLDLTGQMYNYHNTLSEAHAASSPWWAWPFDLKPVWFYQQSFAGDTAAAIYDAGNLVIWWLGVPALAFCTWQAYKRRSLPLALITIGFACQWIAWARIDRAAFQYHYYTALPFVVMALAYFIAEIWHGASRRTWALAKAAAALAVMAPALLWLFHRPLCGFVRVTAVNPGSQACPTYIPDITITARALAIAFVMVVGIVLVVVQLSRLDRGDLESPEGSRQLWPLFGSAFGGVLALALASILFADVPMFTIQNLAVEPVAIVVLIPLAALAVVVASARDARRFVAGLVLAVVAEFVVFYPNLSALPLPSSWATSYQGLLPTYVYPFQFPVSTVDRRGPGVPLLAMQPALLLVALTITCLILAYSAWVWRMTLAERRMLAAEADAGSAWAEGAGGR